ncbi:MAG: hypothetical protein KDC58_12280 [Cyclobacteriaceae bacterium]|nr:hypothetical protein [Cyclobacteriaceae bacterium]
MKKTIYLLVLSLFFGFTLYAQEVGAGDEQKSDSTQTVKKDKPVRTPWNSGLIIGGQTSLIPAKGTIRFDLAHQFGVVNNGITDLLGIYADGANIRMGLNYTIIDNLQVGVGVTKYNITTDLNAKYTVFEQTRKNTMPVSLTLFGNIAIRGGASEAFGAEYEAVDRLSYFSQIIVGRKINKNISVQAAGSFSHINNLQEGINHDAVGISASAKIRVTSTISVITHNDFPLKLQNISEYTEFEPVKPNIQLGAEIITTSHAFHIYVATSNYILPQNVFILNQSELDSEGIRFGFILTRL